MNEDQAKQDWAQYLTGLANNAVRAAAVARATALQPMVFGPYGVQVGVTVRSAVSIQSFEEALTECGVDFSVEDFLKLQAQRGKIDGVPAGLPDAVVDAAIHEAKTGRTVAIPGGTKAFGIDDIAAIFTAIKTIYEIIQKWRGKDTAVFGGGPAKP